MSSTDTLPSPALATNAVGRPSTDRDPSDGSVANAERWSGEMATPRAGRSSATVASTRAATGSTIERLRSSRLAVTTTSGGSAIGEATGETARLGEGDAAGEGETAGEAAGLGADV